MWKYHIWKEDGRVDNEKKRNGVVFVITIID